MKHPLFGDTVTLYHKEDDRYTRFVLRGVQWKQKIERFASQKGTAATFDIKTVTSMTVPVAVADAAKISVCEGDVLVLGDGPELSDAFTIADLKKSQPTYCTVRAVVDNTLRPRLRHWKVMAV